MQTQSTSIFSPHRRDLQLSSFREEEEHEARVFVVIERQKHRVTSLNQRIECKNAILAVSSTSSATFTSMLEKKKSSPWSPPMQLRYSP